LKTTTDFYQYGNKEIFKVGKKCFNIFPESGQKQRERTVKVTVSDLMLFQNIFRFSFIT